MRSEPVCIVVWLWGRGIDDFVAICGPSLLQPDNVPWLLANGFDVRIDFYSCEEDKARAEGELIAFVQAIRAQCTSGTLDYNLVLRTATPGQPDAHAIKGQFFAHVVRTAVAAQHAVVFALADFFFGNGSIRNIATYARKPTVTVSGNYLRVRREPFLALLAEHRARTGEAPVGNARLVDIALTTMIQAMEASVTDVEDNASFRTSGSLRRLSEDVYGFTIHVPTPILCRFLAADEQYFASFNWDFHLIDHQWPGLLMAQHRWRVMASSDLIFFAEVNAPDVAAVEHAYPTEPGMLYNDDYERETMHGRVHQAILITLRRERLPAGEA